MKDEYTSTYSGSEPPRQRICTISGCGGKHLAKGLCTRHYTLNYKYGSTDDHGTRWGAAQLWLNDALKNDTDECLIWPFAEHGGHGVVRVEGRARQAHRVLLSRYTGKNPPDMEACHNCGNGLCCNVKHLRWDTHAGNMADTVRHGTSTRGAKNKMAKLTEDDVRAIREIRESLGASLELLADTFSISISGVSQVVTRKRWGWVI